MPYVRTTRDHLSDQTAHFIITIDCAPIHISEATRTALETELGPNGSFVFLPAGCTDSTQPLDIGCFGALKGAARSYFMSLITNALEHRKDVDRKKLLVNCAQVRHMTLLALCHGMDSVKKSEIIRSWDFSVGRLVRLQGKKGFAVADTHTNHTTALIALQSMGDAAYLLYASQKGKRDARTAILKKAAEEKKSAPRDPEAAHMMFRFGPNFDADSVVDIESARDDAYINHVPTALVERKADAMFVTRQEKFTRLEADDRERDDLDINENSDSEEDIADDEPIAPALLSQIPKKRGTSTLPTVDDAHEANAQFSASLVGNEQFLAEIDALTQGCGLPSPR